MNEREYFEMEEDAAMGEAIAAVFQTILDAYEATDCRSLGEAVYDSTACGAWLSVQLHDGTWRHTGDLGGISNGNVRALLLGSIVEGSDAEVYGRDLDLLVYVEGDDQTTALTAFNDALQEVDDEACRLWDEANEGNPDA